MSVPRSFPLRWEAAVRSVWSTLRVMPGDGVPLPLKVDLAAEILVVYAVTRWRLSRRSFRELAGAIRSRQPARAMGSETESLEAQLVAARLGNAVHRTLRILPTDARCLTQSLVLCSILSARGIPSTLVIGAHSKPDFTAHAWVEHDGQPVLPTYDFAESRLLEI